MSRSAYGLIACAGTLLAIGLVMVFSASSYKSVYVHGTPYLWFSKQVYWSLIALVCFSIALAFDYRKILRLWPLFFGSALVGLCLVFFPPFGRTYNEAARWLSVGPLILQPSEFAKLAVVISLAGFLGGRKERINDFFKTFVPVLGGLCSVFILILVEPDLGTAAFVFGIALLIMLVAGVSVWYLGLAGLFASPAFALFAYVKWEKIVERVKGVIDPYAKYQVLQSLVALGSGGLSGKGLGMSTQKMGFLPEAFTDFIFSIVGEELGFIGCTLIILLFVLLTFFGLRIALGAKDFQGFLLAFGATLSISLQASANIAVVTGSAPTKGIPLPFISYGGSGLVLALIQVGLILNVAIRSCESGESVPQDLAEREKEVREVEAGNEEVASFESDTSQFEKEAEEASPAEEDTCTLEEEPGQGQREPPEEGQEVEKEIQQEEGAEKDALRFEEAEEAEQKEVNQQKEEVTERDDSSCSEEENKINVRRKLRIYSTKRKAGD